MNNYCNNSVARSTNVTSPSLFKAIFTMASFSGNKLTGIYISALLRTLERLVELLPLLVFYSWLMLTLTGQPYLIAHFVNLHNIWVVTCLLVFIFLLQFSLAYSSQSLGFSSSYNLTKQYRYKLYQHIYQLPLATLYQQPVGQLAELITDDIDKVESIFTHLLIEVIACITIACFTIVVLLNVDWQLTLALVCGLALAFYILHRGRKAFITVSQKKQSLVRETSGKIVEFSLGLTTLKLFNHSPQWLIKFKQQLAHINQASEKVEVYGAGPVVLYRLILELGFALLLMACTYQFEHQATSLAVTLFMLLFASKIIAPLLELSVYLSQLRYAAQSEQKLTQLSQQSVLVEPKNAVAPTNNSVAFNHVCLDYQGEKILHNISFTVKPATITAIVGRSGMGKSSILNLLARFAQPSSGTITLGGHNIAAVGSNNLYQQTSMVFQQVQLFATTVIENVRIGKPNATNEEVIAACKKAYCHDFISQLSDGYQTYIGENGAKLSGGQRQRLSIARAFLKEANILLLDEATASIDPNSQYHIQQALTQLVKGKTLIMVAHRLTTIKHAQQILVVDEGRIVEQGNHKTLLNQQGLYQQLWQEDIDKGSLINIKLDH